jgi:GxxExxY protein
MPIQTFIPIRNISKSEFDERDHVVMRCAYDSQNSLGRLCDERVYENDVVRRLREAGFKNVHTQVPLLVTHGAFQKKYRLDLLADDALYELKTVRDFVPEHDAQILNYAMLLAVNHGKLLNFRAARVEGRLRFNVVMPAERYQLNFHELWRPQSERCQELVRHLKDLLSDWGGFLDYHLYEEALIHHFGGKGHALCRFPMKWGDTVLGTHEFSFHAKQVCFMVTGFPNPTAQRHHVTKLLKLSPFSAVQWINLHHHSVLFETIQIESP